MLAASDGVLLARGANDQPFGVERLAEWVAEHRRQAVDRVAEGVIAAVAEFTGGTTPTDDLTVLALRCRSGD